MKEHVHDPTKSFPEKLLSNLPSLVKIIAKTAPAMMSGGLSAGFSALSLLADKGVREAPI